MELIQDMLVRAALYRQDEKKEAALDVYSDAFNLLVEQAAQFAIVETGSLTDEDELRAITPLLLRYSNQYLKRDLTAATILNAMGVLFGELGDAQNAKQKFAEAIEYIPDHASYDDPRQNLAQISSQVIKTAELEEIDE